MNTATRGSASGLVSVNTLRAARDRKRVIITIIIKQWIATWTSLSVYALKRSKALMIMLSTSKSMVEDQDYHVNINCDYSNNNKNTTSGRKKLRLTKQQSTLLEDSFKLHTTLNQSQKQSLAEQLNLKPRQVEVWFQNRRARTKLKQTEVDCEFLKKCCESLSDENKRLKKEVQELQSLKEGGGSQFIQQLPKAAMCPSCSDKTMKKNEAAVIDHVVLKNNKWHSSYSGTN
ncbi:hypothetical protein Dsin_000075 [Dipteronia sinensis]|uniref:Homeobox domain-containing protein n=1 Tax=Dipteronia sinensis TaxID=43782 RepID=A0AAD9ZI92_9ROSI|nr:hypothetical protein Dsin_000075 [Dipteronia sinensis]